MLTDILLAGLLFTQSAASESINAAHRYREVEDLLNHGGDVLA
jgi:hypothetical protein